MKTKTRTPFQIDLDVPTGNATLVRATTPGGDDRDHQADVKVIPRREPRVRLSAIPIAAKPIEEIAVTVRLRADGMLHPCCCGGTGEDGCIVDNSLMRANPQAGFPSYSSALQLGRGSDHE